MSQTYLELLMEYARRGSLRVGHDVATGEGVLALMIEEADGDVRMVPVARVLAPPLQALPVVGEPAAA